MIMAWALAGFIVLLTALLWLLKDFSRFLIRGSRNTSLPGSFVDFGQYLVTWFVAGVMAVTGFFFYKFVTALAAYLLTTDLVSFFVILRGVFSSTSELQDPFAWRSLLAGPLLTPALQFLTFYLITRGIRIFMASMNEQLKDRIYTERDVMYYGFIAVLVFALLEIVFYSQRIPGISGIAHFTYLALTKLSFILYFLTLAHIHLLNHADYRSSLPGYVHLEKMERKIVFHPRRAIALTYGIGILLYVPFFTGTQFAENNWKVFVTYLAVCGVFYYLVRRFLSKGYNYVGVVLLAETADFPIGCQSLPEWTRRRKIAFALGALAAIILLVRPRLLILFGFIVLVAAGLYGTLQATVYLAGLGLSKFRCVWLELNRPVISLKSIRTYLESTVRAVARSGFLMVAVISAVFLLISLHPKLYRDLNDQYLKAVLDPQQDPLFVEFSGGNGCIPLSHGDVPEFLLKCLYIQEDRSFLRQDSWFPSGFPRTSNWHGLSFASYYRAFSGGGGSNLNMQLIKNAAFPGAFPRDVQRKFAETIAAYQLSLRLTPERIVTQYLNHAGMNGGLGHSGLMAASLHTFGLPPVRLNPLEMMYLVETLKRGTSFKTDNGTIRYQQVHLHSGDIKRSLVRQAESWRESGLISSGELASLKSQDLRFVNARYRPEGSNSTRVFLASETERFMPGGMTFTSTIGSENQQKMGIAVRQFESRFRRYLVQGEFRLLSSALVIRIGTGEVIAHYGGPGVVDMTMFSGGNPVGSIIKPFVLLEMLEDGFRAEEIRPYDGILENRETPRNYNRKYSNRRVGIDEILCSSLNAPMVNLRELTDPIMLFSNLEDRFSRMDIGTDRYLELDDPTKWAEIELNYPLGSRNMTLSEIAQAYQALFNGGRYVRLTTVTRGYDPFNDREWVYGGASRQIYDASHVEVIINALKKPLMAGGTAAHLSGQLPGDVTFYAKTGTSEGSIHGYTVLSDGEILIVTHVTYGMEIGQRLELNATPAIPFHSGARSAGILAVIIYNQLKRNENI